MASTNGNGRTTPKKIAKPRSIRDILDGFGTYKPQLGDFADMEDATGKKQSAFFDPDSGGLSANGVVAMAWMLIHKERPEFTLADARALDADVLAPIVEAQEEPVHAGSD